MVISLGIVHIKYMNRPEEFLGTEKLKSDEPGLE